MHYIFHRQKGRKQGSHLPSGLTELMSDISREVLRNPPQDGDVYKFIADYLDSLLSIRQRAQISVDVLDDILESSMVISDLLAKNGIDFKRATAAAKVIQDAFRKYVDQKEKDMPISQRLEFNEFEIFKELLIKCKFKEEELVCVQNVVRIAFRDFFRKYSNYLKTAFSCGHDIWPSVEATLKCWADKVPSREKMDKAATKIQACFRRYSVRNSMPKKSNQSGFGAEYSDESLSEKTKKAALFIQRAYRLYKEDQEKALRMRAEREEKRLLTEAQAIYQDAATKIQSQFRGYKVRKVEADKIPVVCMRANNVDFATMLREKGIQAFNQATAAVQELYRKVHRVNISASFEDTKGVFDAAKRIQDLWHDFTARRDFIRDLYAKMKGELAENEDLWKNFVAKRDFVRNLYSQALSDSTKPGTCPLFDMRKMKRNVRGLITAFGPSENYPIMTETKLQGFYEMKIEWFDEKDPTSKEEDRFAYDAEIDELIMEHVNVDGTVTTCTSPRLAEELRAELNEESEFCMVKVKKNIKRMIQTFGDTRDCEGIKIRVDPHKDGVYKIEVKHFNDKDGPVIDEQMIIYRIDSDRVEVEHVLKDGTVNKYEDKLKEAKINVPKIVGGLGPWGKNIKAMKANLQTMIQAYASSIEGKSESDADFQRQGILKLKMEYTTEDGASIAEDEEIKYNIEDEKLIIEHKNKDGTITNYEENLGPFDSEVSENTSFDQKAFKENIRGIFYALFLAKHSESANLSMNIRDAEETVDTIKKETVTFNIDAEKELIATNEILPASGDEDDNITSIPINEVRIQAAKASALGLLQALRSTKDIVEQSEGYPPSYKGLKLKFEHYDEDGTQTKEEEISLLIDGRTLHIAHISKDGSVTRHEELVPQEGIPELYIPINPSPRFNERALKHHLKSAIEAMSGQKLEEAAHLEPDSQTQGTYKIRVQRIVDGDGKEEGIDNIMYGIGRGDLVVEFLDKDGGVHLREKEE